MIIEKDELKYKAKRDGYGNARHCRICNKLITRNDINNNNFEYVESESGQNFFHSGCVKEEIESARKSNRTKIG